MLLFLRIGKHQKWSFNRESLRQTRGDSIRIESRRMIRREGFDASRLAAFGCSPHWSLRSHSSPPPQVRSVIQTVETLRRSRFHRKSDKSRPFSRPSWRWVSRSLYPFSWMRFLKSRRSSRESTRIEICWIQWGPPSDTGGGGNHVARDSAHRKRRCIAICSCWRERGPNRVCGRDFRGGVADRARSWMRPPNSEIARIRAYLAQIPRFFKDL